MPQLCACRARALLLHEPPSTLAEFFAISPHPSTSSCPNPLLTGVGLLCSQQVCKEKRRGQGQKLRTMEDQEILPNAQALIPTPVLPGRTWHLRRRWDHLHCTALFTLPHSHAKPLQILKFARLLTTLGLPHITLSAWKALPWPLLNQDNFSSPKFPIKSFPQRSPPALVLTYSAPAVDFLALITSSHCCNCSSSKKREPSCQTVSPMEAGTVSALFILLFCRGCPLEIHSKYSAGCTSMLSPVQLCNPTTVACQAPLSMGFSWQEYWSALSFLPPGESS